MANQILAGAVVNAGMVIAGVDANNPPYVGPPAHWAETVHGMWVPSSGTSDQSASVSLEFYISPSDANGTQILYDIDDHLTNNQIFKVEIRNSNKVVYSMESPHRITMYDDHPNPRFHNPFALNDTDWRVPIVTNGPLVGGQLDPKVGLVDSGVYWDETTAPPPLGLGEHLVSFDQIYFYDQVGEVVVSMDLSHTRTGNGFDADGSPSEATSLTSLVFPPAAPSAKWIVVGALAGNGSLYVYDANDLSVQPTVLTAFDADGGDRFGSAASVTSDKIIVGAYFDEENGDRSGSVYVYDVNDLTAQPTKLTAFDGDVLDLFAYNVAATDDKIFISAHLDDDNGSNSGSVYVYDANDLSAQPTKLTAFDGAADSYFGIGIAVTDDNLVISASNDDDNGSNSGSVYVYDANDLSAQPTKLSESAEGDKFGRSISAIADKIVVGAPNDDDRGSNSGSVYVYDANDLSAQPTKLTAGAAGDLFGWSVAATANKIVVGAYRDDNIGSVYVYDVNDLTAQPTKLTGDDVDDYFGYRVAAAADKIVVGSYQDDDNGSNSGSAYVYDANDLTAQPTKLTGENANDRFGFEVAIG